MGKKIAVIGTLDTRGAEIEYLRDRIEERGHTAVVIDIGVLGGVPFMPAFTRDAVAAAAGTTIKDIIALNHEGRALSAMAKGASAIVKNLYSEERLDGAVAAGGSMTTSTALEIMAALPMGVPKLIVSTIAFSPLVKPDWICADLAMMLWPAGLFGLNSISCSALDRAAGAISGAVESCVRPDKGRKKMVGITSLGTSQLTYIRALKPALEERGYDVAVFHSVGMGGKAFEQAISDGLVDFAMDLSLVELLDQINGGATATSGTEHRMEAAGRVGIPQIVAAGAISNFFWFSGVPLPPQFQDRKHYRHNQLLTIVVASTEEKARLGKLVADRLNKATGPTTVVVPLLGSIEGDRNPKSPFHDPRGGEAFCRALKARLRSDIKVVELNAHANDAAFSDMVLQLFDEMRQQCKET
jgi:uncharacterized protein (UPF0261 family)